MRLRATRWTQFFFHATMVHVEFGKMHRGGFTTLFKIIQPNLTLSTVVARKRAHGRSTLQVCQRGGWALFRLFLHLTMKERPRHVYSDLKPSKQIIAHKITYNRITSGFKVESWQHTTFWTARCDGEHSVACSANHVSYVLLCKDALY